ncbi:MAG: DNA mismatch repair endonuclease MutL [Candidatus Berkiella sp.]
MKQARIIQLPPQVANQIAAGEVVERPCSVVKELLENAIDAHATKIEVDIQGAGLYLIRVRDNGVGILKEDLPLAISAHATSKIRTQADLEAITSMGFRGEALASIASISRCRLISKPAHQETAWQIQQVPGEAYTISPAAHPDGTTVEIEDLFYNTPVRRKFLRSEKTEFQAIEEIIKRIALAFSHVTITLKHQQKVIRHFSAAKDGHHESRLAKICGQQFVEHAAFFQMQAGTMALQGWLGFPSLARRSADCQYFFVNQRMVKDRLINHVIKTLYSEHPQMVLGTYPCFVLYLTIDPTEVDVNVHPTKQEVRFSKSTMVHDFLSKCVRDTLFAISQNTGKINETRVTPSHHERAASQHVLPHITPYVPGLALNAFHKATTRSALEQTSIKSFNRYAFLEESQGIVIIDLEKAKLSLTKLYFEQQKGKVPSKSLLFPLCLNVRHHPSNQVLSNLQSLGFDIHLDKHELKVLQQPEILCLTVDTQSMSALLEHAFDIDNLYQQLSYFKLDFENNSLLLTQWLGATPTQGVIRLSHTLLDSLECELAPADI